MRGADRGEQNNVQEEMARYAKRRRFSRRYPKRRRYNRRRTFRRRGSRYRRGNFRRRASLARGNYFNTRYITGYVQIPSPGLTVEPQLNNYSWTLSNIPGFSAMANNYEYYKLRKVVQEYVYPQWMNYPTSGAIGGVFSYYRDYGPPNFVAVKPLEDEMYNNSYCKSLWLDFRKKFSIVIRPKYQDINRQEYMEMPGPKKWLMTQASGSSVQHFGLTTAWFSGSVILGTAIQSTGYLFMRTKYYVSYRNRKSAAMP